MRAPAIAVLILAAGRSARMGGPHKLLSTFGDETLIRRSARVALGSSAARIVVVTGHRGDEIAGALEALPVEIVRNEAYEDGLSTSLRCGFAIAAKGSDGVLVMLADQPALTPAHLDALIAVFQPEGKGSIVVATAFAERGNPVVLSTGFAGEIERLRGDRGARSLIDVHAPLVREVEIGAAALIDVDTPKALREAGGVPEIAPPRRS